MNMVMNPKSKLARLAYWFAEDGPPPMTTLCAFFWRSFLCVPLAWAVIAATAGSLVFLVGLLAIEAPGAFFGLVVGLLLFWFSFATLKNSYRRTLQDMYERITDSTFAQGVKAIKGKVCPIIYFRE